MGAREEDERIGVGLALTLLGVATFSLTLPMTRVAVSALEPVTVALWRAIVAAAVAALVLLARRARRPAGREWGPIALCALGTVFGFPLFTTLAMQSVSASHGAVVVGLLPLATAVCGAAIGGERPSVAFWTAAVAGTALTLLFVLRQAEGGIAIGHAWLGLAVLAASVGYAYGGVAARGRPGWSVACWALVIALPLLLPLALVVPPPALSSTPAALGAFLYLALCSQLLGFFAFYRGLALAGIARGSQVQLLQLFLTIGFAATLFGEAWDAEAVAFGALVVLCVALGTRARIAGAR